MSYHYISNAPATSTTNVQGQTAPPGYHYMPDGTLMSNAEHQRLYGVKTIKSFDLDLSDLSAKGETRKFNIIGDDDAEFILEIKDSATGYYYNFTTETFQANQTRLEKSISNGNYKGSIVFPNTITTDVVNGAVSAGVKVVMDNVVATKMVVGDRVTGNDALNAALVTVAALNPDGDNTSEFSLSSAVAIADDEVLSFSGDDQYDIFLYALPGTRHDSYNEVRFGDGSIDKNSSTGSNSLMMQKVIYQYADTLLTMSMYSIGSAITLSNTNSTINFSRGKSKGKIPFELSTTSASGESFKILRQPTPYDILSYLEVTVGSAPEDLPGENIYPTVNNTDTVDGEFQAAGGKKFVMDSNVATKMAVGDKITGATSTDTVDGAVTSGVKVVMDNNVVGKMAVGDQITCSSSNLAQDVLFNKQIVSVAEMNPDGDNTKEFSMSTAMAIADGATLTFTPKCNRELWTVAALNPDGDNVKEFSASGPVADDNLGLIDGVTLSFSNQMNYQWPLDNIDKITEAMTVEAATNVTTGTSISHYEDTVTIFENTEDEERIVKNYAPATTTKSKTPTITKGLVTTQAGNVVFDKQQVLVLAGDSLKIGGYGESMISSVYGWDIKFSDLKLTLSPITTTTTAASTASTSVAVTARDGILNGVSTVSGIGINPSASKPKVSSGANATGAGTIVLNAAQTLESGITLTFDGAGKTATITGNIEIIKAGTGSPTLRFDVGKLISTS